MELKVDPKSIRNFWSKVDRRGPDECWEWTAYRDKKNYGTFRNGDKKVMASRYSYALHFGAIPEGTDYHGVCVCHKCDNPPCVNPKHLFLGTIQDNIGDRDKKNRQVHTPGESSVRAKLTEEQVRQIRLDTRPQHIIGADYGISQGHVSCLKLRQAWKHVP